MHQVQPKALSITNATEYGLTYSAEEVGALGETAKRHGLAFHMDGARFANAIVSTGAKPADMTWRAGVDVLCFGGTKNGLPVGEAVVFFDRRLAERGQQDSKRMGEEIRELGLDFDLVLSSPAARAAETAELAGLSPRFDERIYDASASQLLALVQSADDAIDRLMLVGHNPGFERLATRLIGQELEMPTGSLLEIQLPIESWADAGSGSPVRFLKPKELA